MVQLLKFKERFFQFVGRFEIYVMAAVRFVIAFAAFSLINSTTGYMKVLSDYPVALILALLCSFLPAGLMMFFGAVLILLQFFALSKELCLIMALVFVVMFCLYFRFTSRKGLYTVLTPLLGVVGIPYTMPVASGLLGAPYTVISVVCGEAVYFILKNVQENSAMFSPSNEAGTGSILTMAVTELLADREMYLYMAAFAAAGVTVYCVRKLAVDHAHTIAVVIGVAVQLGIICAGEIAFGSAGKIVGVIIGCVISLPIALFVDFMVYSLDYTRVEHVQFEDDEYYYYVKAVPKAFVPVEDKQVKQINAKTRSRKKWGKGPTDPQDEEETLEEQVMREFREDEEEE